jgi:hypothetical protein
MMGWGAGMIPTPQFHHQISSVQTAAVYANVLKIVPSCGSIADFKFAGICFKSALSGAKGGIRGDPLGSRTSS